MWRNSGSKLLLSCNQRSYVYASNEDVCLPSQLLSRYLSTTTTTTAAAAGLDLFKLGLADRRICRNGNGVRAFSTAASAAAVDILPLTSVGNLARHYGRCYWELSKARLRLNSTLRISLLSVLISSNF